ncbi:MAG: ATP-binding protein [Anaerolineales bacterium]
MTTHLTLDVPAEHRYLKAIGACLAALLGDCATERTLYNIQLAVHEACVNIIEHAYGDVKGRIMLSFYLEQEPHQVLIELTDTGQSFDLNAIPAPDLDALPERGYGLYLMRQLLDEVSYRPGSDKGNQWRLVKYLTASDT